MKGRGIEPVLLRVFRCMCFDLKLNKNTFIGDRSLGVTLHGEKVSVPCLLLRDNGDDKVEATKLPICHFVSQEGSRYAI